MQTLSTRIFILKNCLIFYNMSSLISIDFQQINLLKSCVHYSMNENIQSEKCTRHFTNIMPNLPAMSCINTLSMYHHPLFPCWCKEKTPGSLLLFWYPAHWNLIFLLLACLIPVRRVLNFQTHKILPFCLMVAFLYSKAWFEFWGDYSNFFCLKNKNSAIKKSPFIPDDHPKNNFKRDNYYKSSTMQIPSLRPSAMTVDQIKCDF